MSGKDERKLYNILDCPLCRERPKYWTLGEEQDRPLCWVYSRKYALCNNRIYKDGAPAVVFRSEKKWVKFVNHGIVYAWCGTCHTYYTQNPFLSTLISMGEALVDVKYEE